MVSIKDASELDISLLRSLAEKIWWPTYRNIISDDQVNYMLENIYGEDNLREGMKNGEKFLLIRDKNTPLGFVSFNTWKEKPSAWKIHKLYVLPENHGSGYGRRLLNEVFDRARNAGITTIALNVNRHNPALAFYERLGFTILREEDIPIGEYWMNDYVMTIDLK
jgi:ribosomal protein S18 acetylase RimI-like enzyme